MGYSESDKVFIDHALDMMRETGAVRAMKMFGGYGLFLDDCMIALVEDQTLYLKTDEVSAQRFVAEGLEPFRYQKGDKIVTMSYHRAPDEVLEDIETMNEWLSLARQAAIRSR